MSQPTSVRPVTASVPLPVGFPGLVRSAVLCLSEARPVVQLVLLLRFASAAVLVGGAGALVSGRVIVSGLGWALANSAVYLFNGIQDTVTDRVNGKGRPLARGDLDPVAARAGCAVLAGGSVLLAAALGGVPLLLTVLLLVAGVGYSWRPLAALRTAYAPVVLISVGGFSTYVAGWRATGRPLSVALVLVAVTMTAWMALVGGLLKDLDDVTGDREDGRRTLAVLRGRATASALGSAAAVTLALLMAAGAVLLHASALGLAGLALALAAAGITRHSRRLAAGRTTSARTPYRRFMVGQYAAHLVVLGAAVVPLLAG